MTDRLTSRLCLRTVAGRGERAARTRRHPAASRAPYVRLVPAAPVLSWEAEGPSLNCRRTRRLWPQRNSFEEEQNGFRSPRWWPPLVTAERGGWEEEREGRRQEQSFPNVVRKEPLYWASEREGGRTHPFVLPPTNPLKETKSLGANQKVRGGTDVRLANDFSKAWTKVDGKGHGNLTYDIRGFSF